MIYYLQLVLGGLIAGPGGASHRMVRPAGAPKTTKDLFAILGIPCTTLWANWAVDAEPERKWDRS